MIAFRVGVVWAAMVSASVTWATAAAAQQASPYKLIVASSEGGVTAIDYPSAARCERAKQTIEAEMKRRNDEARNNLPPGAILTNYGWQARAICIPG